ncbi:MAG: hypothetical protein ABSE51_12200 [Terracidiphilus sp.]|jgi:hypothetical protein
MQFAAFLLQYPTDPSRAEVQKVMLALMAILPILMIVCAVGVIVPFWFICKKAGFSPWLSLLNIVPLGGPILWYVLAFSEWKVVPVPLPVWAPPPQYPPQPPTSL